jgi:hypothetical protein
LAGVSSIGEAEEDYRVQSTDYRETNKGEWLAGVWSLGEVKGGERQWCKSANRPTACAKVEKVNTKNR